MKKLVTLPTLTILMLTLFMVSGTALAQENELSGTDAGGSLTTGTDDAIYGDYAGQALTTGSGDTFLGYGAGRNMTTTRGSILIGYLAGDALTVTDNHLLVIGTQYYPSNGIFGNFSTGFFGINNTAPGVALDVTGAIRASGALLIGGGTTFGSAIIVTPSLHVNLNVNASAGDSAAVLTEIDGGGNGALLLLANDTDSLTISHNGTNAVYHTETGSHVFMEGVTVGDDGDNINGVLTFIDASAGTGAMTIAVDALNLTGFSGGVLVGTDDTLRGKIYIYGSNASAGAQLGLYNAANEDGTGYQGYFFEATGTTLSLGGDATTNVFQFGYDGVFTLGSDSGNYDGVITGISLDASTSTITWGIGDTLRVAGHTDFNIDSTMSVGNFESATSGGITLVASDNDQGVLAINTNDQIDITGFSGGIVIGISDTESGTLLINGNSSTSGGKLRIYNAADEDGTGYDYYQFESIGTTFSLGGNVDTDVFTFNYDGSFLARKQITVGDNTLNLDGTVNFIDADGNSFGITGGEDRLVFASSTGKSELHIDYLTGAIAAGTEHSIIHINIEDITATGGLIHAINISDVGTGVVTVVGLNINPSVKPITQHTGSFSTPDKALKFYKLGDPSDTTNVTTAFGSTIADSTLFDHDDDEVLLGAAAVFNEFEVILNTAASGPGVKPTFWYSSGGDGSWSPFNPEDGSNGFRDSGIIEWVSGDLSWTTWDYNGTDQYWIKIIRTQASLATSPIEDTFKLLASTDFTWDENGDIAISDIYAADGVIIGTDQDDNMIDDSTTGSGSTQLWIGNEYILASGDLATDTWASNITLGATKTVHLGDPTALTDGQYTGETVEIEAGEALVVYDLCYVKYHTTAPEAWEVDATTLETVEAQIVMCLEATLADGVKGTFLVCGYIREDDWTWVAGDIWNSTTTAQISQTAPAVTGEYAKIVGHAWTGDIMRFNPAENFITVP